eukprot:gene13046-14311_t
MATSIRGKDWIFNALWGACGPGVYGSASCVLNIPITFLFKDGLPVKVLTTDPSTGKLQRIYLDQIQLSRFDFSEGFRGPAMHSLRGVLKLLEDYQLQNQYNAHQDDPNNPYLAKVIYIDDETENLTRDVLTKMLRMENWRMQVLLIQGFVPISSVQSGFYSQKPQVRSKLDTSMTETADGFAKSIAKYVERAYSNPSQSWQQSTDTADTTGTANQAVNLKVDTVEIKTNRFEVEEMLRNEKLGRQRSAAEKVFQEFMSLLLAAHGKGQSVEQIFRHFDEKDNRFIQAEDLVNGLAKLGIGVTFPVAEHVMQLIGGIGHDFLMLDDFQTCLTNALQEKYALGDMEPPPKPMTAQEKNEIRKTKQLKKDKKKQELYPPAKDPKVMERVALDINKSQSYDWHALDDGPQIKQKKDLGPLPLPEEMYTTTVQPPHISATPSWITQRTKRALKDLHETNQKVIKRRKENTKNSQLAASKSQTSLEDEEDDFTLPPSLASISERNELPPKPKKLTKSKSARSLTSTSSKDKVTPLNLQTIVSDPTHLNSLAVSNILDELLHIDGGVVMTYRVLDGIEIHHRAIRTKEKTDSLRYHSILSMRDQNLTPFPDEESEDFNKTENKQSSPSKPATASSTRQHSWLDDLDGQEQTFTLVVVPDITMSLDTLQSQLEILLKSHPFIRIVLVGLIGLPNTVWPNNWVINSELQAKCIGNLLTHLNYTNRLFYRELNELGEEKKNDKLFMMGFGVGVYHLTRFMTDILPNLEVSLQSTLHHLIFVNGILKYSKKFKRLCKDFYTALLQANIYEANELMISLHFFDEYLAMGGADGNAGSMTREECLKKFWATRRSLYARKDTDNESEEAKKAFERNGVVQVAYKGIIEQLKGILISPEEYDGAMILVQHNTPIVVVQSTEDVFIDPKAAAIYSSQQLPPERRLVTQLEQSIDKNSVYVSWLKAGHEILQERNSFVLSIISNLAKLYGIQSYSSLASNAAATMARNQKKKKGSTLDENDDDIFDVLSFGEKVEQFTNDMANASLLSTTSDEDLNTFQLSNMEDEEEEAKELNTTMSSEKVSALQTPRDDFEDYDEMGDESSIVKKRNQQESIHERLQRAQLNVERKKKAAKQARALHMEIFYQREQEARDRANEQRERKLMTKEDARSKFAADFLTETEIQALTKQIAREKAIELKRLRKEEAIKRVEEEMARKRSERIEQRRSQAKDLVTRIQQEELLLQGMKEGNGYALPKDYDYKVNEVIEASNRILKDLMECRQKYLESIKRQKIMEDKFLLYKQQLISLENEERRLVRAIRLIEINPSIVGNEMQAASQLHELRQSLSHKQDILLEMKGVLKEREQQFYASNRSVQILKLASKERDLLMSQRIQQLNKIEIEFNHKLKDLKMTKEQLTVTKDRVRVKILTQQKRVDALSKELSRVRAHKSKLIDTDIWMEGVMQRCVTKELKSHLKKEMKRLEEEKLTFITELEEVKLRILNVSDSLAQRRRDVDKIAQAIKILFNAYDTLQQKKVEEMVDQMRQIQEKAMNLEVKRHKELNLEKLIVSSTMGNQISLIDKVRLKDYELRTKDERQLIGMDLILNPQEYLHLTSVEAEQMAFDEDYQCHLSKSDLQRILALPEAINLALPFLHTSEEINAHRILTKYYKLKDEAHYRQLDFLVYERIANTQDIFSAKVAPKKQLSGFISGASSFRGGSTERDEDGSMSIMSDEYSASLQADLFSVVSMRHIQDAEVIHDLLVRESLRDRLRAAYLDEVTKTLTEEEKRFIVIDKIIFPHVYGVDEEVNDVTKSHLSRPQSDLDAFFSSQNAKSDAAKTAAEKDYMKEVNSRSIQSLNNFVSKNAEVPGKRPLKALRFFNQRKGNKADTSAEGDMYEVLREHFDNYHIKSLEEAGVEDLFNYNWACPFNREELLVITQTPSHLLNSEDERYVKKLLDKYHISDEESIMGHAKCEIIQEVSHKMVKLLTKAKKSLKRDIKQNHKSYNLEQKKYNEEKMKSEQLMAQLDGDSLTRAEEGDLFDGNGSLTKRKNSTLLLNDANPSPLSSPTETARSAILLPTTKGIHTIAEEREGQFSSDEDDEDVSRRDKENQAQNIRRIWGSWNTVHPASQGSESQTSYFLLSTYNATRDHPAAFALRHEDDESASDGTISSQEGEEGLGTNQNNTDDESSVSAQLTPHKQSMTPANVPTLGTVGRADSSLSRPSTGDVLQQERNATLKLRQKGMSILLNPGAVPSGMNSAIQTGRTSASESSIGRKKRLGHRRKSQLGKNKKPKNLYHICEDTVELAQQDPMKVRGKIMLLQVKDPHNLFSLKETTIQSRQSRSHYFTIPDRENLRVLEFTVSIVFQGNFTTHGYKLGRLAASLFRLPDEQQHSGDGSSALPIPVGWSPYESCSPNLPHSLGRLVIFHKPKEKPISPGNFQIVIGAAAATKYSIEVIAKVAEAALPVVDDALTKAKTMQSRLPVCLTELDSIAESVILAEKKLSVCEKLIVEAQAETSRTQQGIKLIREKLMRDDEELFLLEDERRDLLRELQILETEYAQWARMLGSRLTEKQDIRDGIAMMYSFQRDREKEKKKIQEDLETYRRDLPACIRILRNMTEAVNAANALNTIVQGVSEEAGAAATGDWGAIKISTPAEDVRRVMKQYGFDALTLEEQQWSLLDQALHPDSYDWLKEAEEKERQERIILGKAPKEKKRNPALEPFRLNKSEIEYLLATPFSMLTRREVTIRKLLTKYHDDIETMKKAISAVGLSFDPHLAEKIRAKHPRSYTKEEKEWSTIDRILHPEIWDFYVNRAENFLDRHQKEAEIDPDGKKKGKKGKKKTKRADGTSETEKDDDDEEEKKKEEQDKLNLATSVALNEGEDFNAIIERMQRTASVQLRQSAIRKEKEEKIRQESMVQKEWSCQLSRDEIIKIWRTPRIYLKSENERKVHTLLHKYNGSYLSYLNLIEEGNKRKAKMLKEGAHIQWEKTGKLLTKDIDFRARQILREIDRAMTTKNEFIHSDVLHANDQKFPTKVLRTHLEEALDQLLIDQIKDRERADMLRIDSSDDDYDYQQDEEEEEEEEETEGEHGRKSLRGTLSRGSASRGASRGGTTSQQGKRKKKQKKGARDVDDEFTVSDFRDGGNDNRSKASNSSSNAAREEILAKVKKRSEKRLQRKQQLKQISEEEEILKTKKFLQLQQQKEKEMQSYSKDILKAMVDKTISQSSNFCLACRTKRCEWKSSIDYNACMKRKRELDEEIERIRLDKHNL